MLRSRRWGWWGLVWVLQAALSGAAWAARVRPLEADEAAPRELTYLGLLPHAEAPQVLVQTNEPTAAHLERIGHSHYRLHLSHAAMLRHIWTLPLEAACFGGPIERVLATPQEEPDDGTAIELWLHRPSRVRLHAEGRNWLMTVLPDKAVPAARPRPRPRAGRQR
jgi:hypothetical protein